MPESLSDSLDATRKNVRFNYPDESTSSPYCGMGCLNVLGVEFDDSVFGNCDIIDELCECDCAESKIETISPEFNTLAEDSTQTDNSYIRSKSALSIPAQSNHNFKGNSTVSLQTIQEEKPEPKPMPSLPELTPPRERLPSRQRPPSAERLLPNDPPPPPPNDPPPPPPPPPNDPIPVLSRERLPSVRPRIPSFKEPEPIVPKVFPSFIPERAKYINGSQTSIRKVPSSKMLQTKETQTSFESLTSLDRLSQCIQTSKPEMVSEEVQATLPIEEKMDLMVDFREHGCSNYTITCHGGAAEGKTININNTGEDRKLLRSIGIDDTAKVAKINIGPVCLCQDSEKSSVESGECSCGNVHYKMKCQCKSSSASSKEGDEIAREYRDHTMAPALLEIEGELPKSVRYALTRISRFTNFTTYEVMKSTSKPPKVIPKETEGIFVLKRDHKNKN